MRKQKILSLLFVLFLSGGIFHSCQESDEHENRIIGEHISVDAARVWYENHKPSEVLLKSISDSNDTITGISYEPLWEYSRLYGNEDFELLEIELRTTGRISTMDNATFEKYNQTKDNRYKQSFSRFVYLFNKQKNKSVGFIMTIIPDLSYIEQSSFQTFRHNSYLTKDDTYSGLVYYYKLDGSFVNGWRYEKGIVTGIISEYVRGDKIATKDMSVSCKDYETWDIYEYCYYYYTESGNHSTDPVSNGCQYTSTQGNYMTVCSWLDDGTIGGGYTGDFGSGGGGGVEDNNKPKTPCDKAKSLNKANNALHNKVKSFFNSVLSAKAGDHESGWVKTADGKYISPGSITPTSLTYRASDLSGIKATESYHTHPTGSCIPSWGDLKRLAKMYKAGQIDVDNFSYGVITSMGCTSMVISNESEFSALADRVLNDSGQFKDDYDEMTKLGGGVEQTIANFLKGVGTSGLKVILNEPVHGNDNSTTLGSNWSAKETNSSGALTNSNCK